MVQQISLLHLIQVQDFTHHFTHGVPRSEPVLTSLQEVRQAIKDGEMCACDFASSQEECGRDAELYLDTKHWQREGENLHSDGSMRTVTVTYCNND
jgi:hypothetical protein